MTPILLLTRPKGQNASFSAAIRAKLGREFEVVASPLLAIQFLPVPAVEADAVVLTSLNGVRAAVTLGLADGRRAWCVGQRTAEAADAAGFSTKTGPGDASGLVAHIISAQPIGKLAHIRGVHTRGDVAAKLNANGIPCADIPAYDQMPLHLSEEALAALDGKIPVVLPLFSPRTATILSEQGPFAAPLHLVAMSAAVAEAAAEVPWASVSVATSPDADAMTQAVLGAFARI